MAAIDYEIVTGLTNAYFVKKAKPGKKNAHIMSVDRRVITNNEIIGLFEFYLRNWCQENKGKDEVVICGGGKRIFEAKLLDKVEGENEKAEKRKEEEK